MVKAGLERAWSVRTRHIALGNAYSIIKGAACCCCDWDCCDEDDGDADVDDELVAPFRVE